MEGIIFSLVEDMFGISLDSENLTPIKLHFVYCFNTYMCVGQGEDSIL